MKSTPTFHHVPSLKSLYVYTERQKKGITSLEQTLTPASTLKASFNNVFTLKNLSYMSQHAIIIFDKVLKKMKP